MYARVSNYEAGDPEGLIEGFEKVSGSLDEIDGFSHGYFMVDRGSGKAISITIWQSEEALLASRSKADELRKQATAPSDASINSVEHYEITSTVGAPTAARA